MAWLTVPVLVAVAVDFAGFGLCRACDSSLCRVLATFLQFPGSIILGMTAAVVTCSVVFRLSAIQWSLVLLLEFVLITLAFFAVSLPIHDIRQSINAP